MNNDLISRSALKEHKFVGNKYVQSGSRTNGKTLEYINKAYQQGWNDAIDAIIDNAPTVKGEWYYNYQNGWHCSICNKSVKDMPTVMGKADFNFCPNCGVEMKVGAE